MELVLEVRDLIGNDCSRSWTNVSSGNNGSPYWYWYGIRTGALLDWNEDDAGSLRMNLTMSLWVENEENGTVEVWRWLQKDSEDDVELLDLRITNSTELSGSSESEPVWGTQTVTVDEEIAELSTSNADFSRLVDEMESHRDWFVVSEDEATSVPLEGTAIGWACLNSTGVFLSLPLDLTVLFENYTGGSLVRCSESESVSVKNCSEIVDTLWSTGTAPNLLMLYEIACETCFTETATTSTRKNGQVDELMSSIIVTFGDLSGDTYVLTTSKVVQGWFELGGLNIVVMLVCVGSVSIALLMGILCLLGWSIRWTVGLLRKRIRCSHFGSESQSRNSACSDCPFVYSETEEIRVQIRELLVKFQEWKQYLPGYVFTDADVESASAVSPPATPSTTSTLSLSSVASTPTAFDSHLTLGSVSSLQKSSMDSILSSVDSESPRTLHRSRSRVDCSFSRIGFASRVVSVVCISLRIPTLETTFMRSTKASKRHRDEVVGLFAKIMDRVRRVVEQRRGIVLDFDLHRIVVVFGVRIGTSSSAATPSDPDPESHLAKCAVRFAIDMRSGLDVLLHQVAEETRIAWGIGVSHSFCLVGSIGSSFRRRLSVIGPARSRSEFLASWAVDYARKLIAKNVPEGDHQVEIEEEEDGFLVCDETVMRHLDLEYFLVKPLDIILWPSCTDVPLSPRIQKSFCSVFEIVRLVSTAELEDHRTSAIMAGWRDFQKGVELLHSSNSSEIQSAIVLIQRFLQVSTRNEVSAHEFLDFAKYLWDLGSGLDFVSETKAQEFRNWTNQSVISLLLGNSNFQRPELQS